MNRPIPPEIQKRIAIEKRIASRIVTDALAQDYMVSVFDGEEYAVVKSRDKKQILGAMFDTDDVRLVFRRPDTGVRIGMVYLVYGNSGYDVICDYSDNLMVRAIVAGAEKLADEIDAATVR